MNRSEAAETKLTRRGLMRAGVRIGVGGLAIGAPSAAWGRFVEVDWVEVKKLELKLPRLPKAFDGVRIAQISDIHIEGGDMRDRFAQIAELVTAQKADMIVLTGDYTTHPDNWQMEPLVDGFKRLIAPMGVYGVLGNHDGWPGSPSAESLVRGGVRLLRNEAVEIKKGGDTLYLCGLDDWMASDADVPLLLSQLPPDAGAILLHHEPDTADVVAPSGQFDLMLSGHSHGGQIALPIIGPLRLPPCCRKYPRGLYQIGDMQLYTNRGLGTVELAVRFCARPEITVFTLRTA